MVEQYRGNLDQLAKKRLTGKSPNTQTRPPPLSIAEAPPVRAHVDQRKKAYSLLAPSHARVLYPVLTRAGVRSRDILLEREVLGTYYANLKITVALSICGSEFNVAFCDTLSCYPAGVLLKSLSWRLRHGPTLSALISPQLGGAVTKKGLQSLLSRVDDWRGRVTLYNQSDHNQGH